jgi:broad specificity phosphatase PhoE
VAVSDGVLLLRHGASTWNAERRIQGQGDPPLTDEGRLQAHAAAVALREFALTRIIASDLQRAAETARIIAAALGLELRFDQRWRERDVGAWTGMTRGEIRARWPDSQSRRGLLGSAEIGGEDDATFSQRVRSALGDAIAGAGGAGLLVVTHRRVIKQFAPTLRPANCEIVPLPAGAWRQN